MRLLITTDSKLQAEAILVTLTNEQTECISEVFENLLSLPVSNQTKLLLVKNKTLLAKISDSTSSIRERKQLIQKSAKRIIAILISAKKRLLSVL